MENRAHAIVAGLFTLLLAGAAVLAVTWLSGEGEGSRELLLLTERSVTGLNVQASVRFRGIRCGKVTAIGIDPQDPRLIRVTVQVEPGLPLTTATVAELKTQGLTGLTYIDLEDPGYGAEPLPQGDGQPPRLALKPSLFDLAGDEVGATLGQVRELVQRVNLVLSDDNLQSLTATLGSLDQAAAELKLAAEGVRPMLTDLRQLASRENIARVSRLLADLEQAGDQAAPLAAELRSLLVSLRTTSESLESAGTEATAELRRTLPQASRLLQDLSGNSRQLSRLLDDLERSPNLLLFGRPAPRPGPGEDGFAAGR